MPYKLNKDRPYNAKTDKNRRSWKIIVEVIGAKNGQADLSAIKKALAYTYKDDKQQDVVVNHVDFAGYMTRGGYLVEVKV